jgi:hypothetical protein
VNAASQTTAAAVGLALALAGCGGRSPGALGEGYLYAHASSVGYFQLHRQGGTDAKISRRPWPSTCALAFTGCADGVGVVILRAGQRTMGAHGHAARRLAGC